MEQPFKANVIQFFWEAVPETFHLVYVSYMASPDLSSIAMIYERRAPAALFELLQKQAGVRIRRGIYSLRVVVWMMMLQRLHAKGTCALVCGSAAGCELHRAM